MGWQLACLCRLHSLGVISVITVLFFFLKKEHRRACTSVTLLAITNRD